VRSRKIFCSSDVRFDTHVIPVTRRPGLPRQQLGTACFQGKTSNQGGNLRYILCPLTDLKCLSHHAGMTPAHTQSQGLLTEKQASRVLTVSVAALRRWRIERRGPRYLKLGSLVRYRVPDLEAWLSSCSSEAVQGW
jgi:hypothetical protein